MHPAVRIGSHGCGRILVQQRSQFLVLLLNFGGKGWIGLLFESGTGSKRVGRVTVEIRIENISTIARRDLWLLLGKFEGVVAFLQVFPEREVRIAAIGRHILQGHAKGICLHLKLLLATGKRAVHEGVDFADTLVGHRVTSRRRTCAVNHQRFAGVAQCCLEAVRITKIERQIKLRFGIQHA